MKPAFDCPQNWKPVLEEALSTQRAFQLDAYLRSEEEAGKGIFPPRELRFLALQLVDPQAVKVVIIGQDPYHGAGQAHGLSFSVPDGVRPPPSLRNIFKEQLRDLAIAPPRSGNLQHWAQQGVLLLNTVLSVEEAKAGSHQGLGWEEITDTIIAHAGRGEAPPAAFLLWGSHAHRKKPLIDAARHLILEAPHPSPLSAHRGFIGCGHFSAANQWLEKNGRSPVRW